MRQLILAIAFLPLPVAAQQATLVYRLGKDTVAIEQYTHQNNRIAGMMVQRAGAAVTVTRYEVAYGSNGRPTSAKIARSPSPSNATPIRQPFSLTVADMACGWVEPHARLMFLPSGCAPVSSIS